MEKKIHPEVCSKSIIANNSTNTTTSSFQNPRYLWKLLSFEFCKTLGYAYFSMIKSFSQDQFSVCMSLQSKLIWLSGYTACELLWKDKTAPQSPPAPQQFAFIDEDGRPEVQLHTGALPSCRLSDLRFCAIKRAAHTAFSQTLLRNALLARAGWASLSAISVTQALTVPPFSLRGTRCLGSEAAFFHLTEKPTFPTLARR